MPKDKKIRKKEEISEYYAFIPKKLIKIIYEQLIYKKLLYLVDNSRKKLKNLWLVKNFLI